MNTSWWRSLDDLTDAQKNFIRLPATGKHLLTGPPGSGKTNLLLLRAEYLAGTGLKNILVITFTRSLANFIKSGISAKKRIDTTQIKTYHSWAYDHIYHHLGEYPEISGDEFSDAARKEIVCLLKEANKNLAAPKLYDAIFVDEAQDLTTEELELLLCLSNNISICGDGRQGIYNKNGLEISQKLELQTHSLTEHFRIGHAIAKVADKILQPADAADSLEATSNYDLDRYGEASVKVHLCDDREHQFDAMISNISIQLDAYPDETIGIICASRNTRADLAARFNQTELANNVCAHGLDQNPDFNSRRVHILTAHSAKGTEFRALHIYAAEEFASGPFRRSKLSYTVVTRAKTSLNIYKTGNTTPVLESALAEPMHLDLKDLF